jgi:hypothetical protein
MVTFEVARRGEPAPAVARHRRNRGALAHKARVTHQELKCLSWSDQAVGYMAGLEGVGSATWSGGYRSSISCRDFTP